MFFVISGFVVTPLIIQIFDTENPHSGRWANLAAFYKRRFFRLAPALGTALIGATLLIALTGTLTDLRVLVVQALSTFLLLGNIGAYRFTGNYFGLDINPLIHTWSLSVEEQIYIFLPIILLLVIIRRKSITKQILLYQGIFFTLSILLFALVNTLAPMYQKIGISNPLDLNFYSPLSRIWEFCLGGIIFSMSKDKVFQPKVPLKIFNIAVALGFILIFTKISLVNQQVATLIACLICAAAILFRSLDSLPKKFTRIGEWLGDRSYSIYLVHMPLIFVATKSPLFTHVTYDKITIPIAVLLSLALGSINYTKIENRFRYKTEQESSRAKFRNVFGKLTLAPTLALAAALVMFPALEARAGIPKATAVAPYLWDTNCAIMITGKFHTCSYPLDGATSTLMVIGDSHAATISKMIISVGKKYGLQTVVATSAGCPQIFEKDSASLKDTVLFPAARKNCSAFNRKVRAEIKRIKPTAIIYSSASSGLYSLTNSREDWRRFTQAVLSNLVELKKLTPHLIIVGPVPERRYPSLPEFALNRDVNLVASRIDNAFWLAASARYEFDFLDAYSVLCPSAPCQNRKDGTWLYNDGNHLSLAGGDILIPALSNILNRVSAT
jgi:peptidoglycan/LPS O-acetylase OafA/YrhL